MSVNSERPSSIEKALDALVKFIPYNQEMGTTELSRLMGMHKATASRILLTLVKKNFLYQDPVTKKFRLGPIALQLGNAVNRSLKSGLTSLAKPVVDKLRDTLLETVTLETFYGMQSIMTYVADGPKPVRVAVVVGDALPSHAAAGAKAILAFTHPEIRSRCVKGVLKRYTAATIVTANQFQRHLAEVRLRGYAMDLGEIEAGINAVSVPIFNHDKQPVAALVVVGPETRVPGDSKDRLIGELMTAAGNIAGQLYYQGDFYRKHKLDDAPFKRPRKGKEFLR
jgi:DNA-binding IclR family transcriptional regulator